MTLRELSEELKKITYGESSDELSDVAAIVNMSLARLYSDVRMTSVYSFYKNEILPIMRPLSFHKKGGEDLTLPLAGRAYGMHISGKGVFRVTTDTEDVQTAFDTYGEFFSGKIQGKGVISFIGDSSYDVYSLSFYDEIGAEDLSDIPTGYPKSYDLADMIPCFGAPCSMPKDAQGQEIDGAEYIGNKLLLPPDHKGLVSIEYSLIPGRVSELLADGEIISDNKYIPHLLHLSAYYSLLESEAELADKHMACYLAMLPDKLPKREYNTTKEYLIEDGWA